MVVGPAAGIAPVGDHDVDRDVRTEDREPGQVGGFGGADGVGEPGQLDGADGAGEDGEPYGTGEPAGSGEFGDRDAADGSGGPGEFGDRDAADGSGGPGEFGDRDEAGRSGGPGEFEETGEPDGPGGPGEPGGPPPGAGGPGRGDGYRWRPLATALGVVVVLGALITVAVPVIAGSDAVSTRLVTAPPAPTLPVQALPDPVRVRWSERSVPADGPVVDAGTVVVGSSNTLSGRDPVTGTERWSYRRGNARLCAWTLEDGAVVAVFGKGEHCSDLIALEAGTGARRFYRNGDLGPDVELTSADGVVIARSGDQLLAFDTVTGLNRWTARRPTCSYGPVAVSGLGAATVLRCPGGQTLIVMHDAYADKEVWTAVPTGADATVVAVAESTLVLSVVDGVPTVTSYDQKGKVLRTIADRRFAGSALGAPTGTTVGTSTLIWTGAAVVAVDRDSGRVDWAVPALGPPLVDGDGVLLAERDGFVQRAVTGGEVLRRAPITGGSPPQAAWLSRIGALVVAAGPDGVTAYG